MKKLTKSAALETLASLKKGTFHHFFFTSAPKDAIGGGVIEKVHDYIARVAIKNSNRKAYVAPTKHNTPNPDNEVVIANLATKYAKTGNTLATLYPVWKRCHATYIYRHDGIEETITKEVAEGLYAKPQKAYGNGELPPMISVNCDNFISIK